MQQLLQTLPDSAAPREPLGQLTSGSALYTLQVLPASAEEVDAATKYIYMHSQARTVKNPFSNSSLDCTARMLSVMLLLS